MDTKLALLFPGQGLNIIGNTIKELSKNAVIKETFEEAGDVLKYDLLKACTGNNKNIEEAHFIQPAIVTLTAALYKNLSSELNPNIVCAAGHSLGEYTALYSSGIISFSELVRLANKRGELVAKIPKKRRGRMVAVIDGIPETVNNVCTDLFEKGYLVTIANYNSPRETVIAGDDKGISKICDTFSKTKAKILPLRTVAAFHSPIMDEIVPEFKDELLKTCFKKGSFPVISNVTASEYSNNIGNNLLAHVNHPVLWKQSINYIIEKYGDINFLELSPANTLTRFIKSINNKALLTNSKRLSLYDAYSNNKDFVLTQQEFIEIINGCLRIAVTTKNNNKFISRKEYQHKVAEPYNEIKNLLKMKFHHEVENNALLRKALSQLRVILQAKNYQNAVITNFIEGLLVNLF
jgi:[acyl-carrier-protein] S-malonyltransferase